jgi:hypothetical protein
MSNNVAKVCIHCRQDCSKKARTKDGQGRYACEECQLATFSLFDVLWFLLAVGTAFSIGAGGRSG